MKKILVIFTMAFAICSCSKSNEVNSSEKPNTNIDVYYQIFIENSKGENLLTPDVNGSYKLSEIRLFKDAQLSDSVIDTFIKLNKKYGYFLNISGIGSDIKNDDDGNTLTYKTLYLQLDSTTVDTIYSESIYIGESILLHKVIYNSEVVFYDTKNSRAITIIKK